MSGDYQPEHKALMDHLLLTIPGVQAGQMFGYPAYRIQGKVFAFVGGPGIAIKLPRQRVEALLAQGNAALRPFEPAEGIIWREWIAIDHADSEVYRQYEPLYTESIEFVIG